MVKVKQTVRKEETKKVKESEGKKIHKSIKMKEKREESRSEKVDQKEVKSHPLDKIFSKLKKKKLNEDKSSMEKKKKKKRKKKKKDEEEQDNYIDVDEAKKPPRKHTEDGLPIYSVDELKIGKGGDTGKCPFDCDCCF